jgi:hypothetical protein
MAMRIACWIPTAKETQSEYVVIMALPMQICLHLIASLLPYKHIVCLVYDSYIQNVNILC